MNLLFPRLSLRQFLGMLGFGAAGAVIAGLYGIVHDQITFTLGPEYFTRFKFEQFAYLDTTQPARWVVAQIGFLATWWVGFFAGWFLGRVTLPHAPWRRAARQAWRGVLLMLATAVAFGTLAAFWAPSDTADPRLPAWENPLHTYRVEDVLGFIRVGCIHNASYLGGLVGLIAALLWLRLSRRRWAQS